MKTSNRAAIKINRTYGWKFFREYSKWRHAGFGMSEALNRIRTAHNAGWSAIA